MPVTAEKRSNRFRCHLVPFALRYRRMSTAEDKARLREVDADQSADEASREADEWNRNALKIFVIVGVTLWLLGVAVWLLVVLL